MNKQKKTWMWQFLCSKISQIFRGAREEVNNFHKVMLAIRRRWSSFKESIGRMEGTRTYRSTWRQRFFPVGGINLIKCVETAGVWGSSRAMQTGWTVSCGRSMHHKRHLGTGSLTRGWPSLPDRHGKPLKQHGSEVSELQPNLGSGSSPGTVPACYAKSLQC